MPQTACSGKSPRGRSLRGNRRWPVPAGSWRRKPAWRRPQLVRLSTVFTTPGFTDERIHLYLAKGLHSVALAREPDEFITVHEKRWSVVGKMIRTGKIRDGKSLCALMYVNCFLREPGSQEPLAP